MKFDVHISKVNQVIVLEVTDRRTDKNRHLPKFVFLIYTIFPFMEANKGVTAGQRLLLILANVSQPCDLVHKRVLSVLSDNIRRPIQLWKNGDKYYLFSVIVISM